MEPLLVDIEIESLAKMSLAVRESTLKRLRLVPYGSENFRVSENSMSFVEVAAHLIHMDIKYCDAFLTRHLKLNVIKRRFAVADRSEYEMMIDELERTKNIRYRTILAMTDAELSEVMEVEQKHSTSSSSLRSMMHTYLNHEAHHRGQISVYLTVLEDQQTPSTKHP
jgi:uncharacterized damage-inducible protein DinB